jgi:hypothetical protein
VDQTIYHVVLDGRKIGPYDRRTIVGMRIKKALTSDHVLIGGDGTQLTVAELIGSKADAAFTPDRSGTFSGIQARFPASLVSVRGRGLDIPRFQGEVEARIQKEMLRLSGRFRSGFGWKEDRVKIPLANVMHARAAGTQVEMWLRPDSGAPAQQVTLELFMPEVATELAAALPSTAPPAPLGGGVDAATRTFWIATLAVLGVAIALGVLLVAVLWRR